MRNVPSWGTVDDMRRRGDRGPAVAALAGLAVLAAYLLPGLFDPGARWPLWDARVYWWGGLQAARGGPLYASGGPFSFTYPPFAAALFRIGAATPEGWLAAVITAGSILALVALCWQALGAAAVRRRPQTVFAVAALALLTWPVDYTLHLGEVDLIVAALVGADLLARRDGSRWQGITTGLAAGIKLTPLIFVVYLLLTWAVPLLIGLVTTAWRRRSRAWGLVAVAVAVAFSGLVPLPGPGRPPSPVLLAAGDLYVLCGLALLAGAALILARESAPARRGLAASNLTGPPWRSWPSLIGWTMAWSPEVRLPSHQNRRQR